MTRPISRNGIRSIARIFRSMFHLSCKESVPVVDLLDRFCHQLGDVSYDVVDDWELPYNIPAVTEIGNDGMFTITIKNSIYHGAKYRDIGGYRNHIMHEMCHVILFKIGFTPIAARSFSNNKIEPMRSAEWQAMALCGEIMIPYEETKNMSVGEIMETYKVSNSSARKRKTY